MAGKFKSQVWYQVTCPVHGEPRYALGDDNYQKSVLVPAPNNKRERRAGCPRCKNAK